MDILRYSVVFVCTDIAPDVKRNGITGFGGLTLALIVL